MCAGCASRADGRTDNSGCHTVGSSTSDERDPAIPTALNNTCTYGTNAERDFAAPTALDNSCACNITDTAEIRNGLSVFVNSTTTTDSEGYCAAR